MEKNLKSAVVLIIGYGSMGRRRIRILQELIPNIKISCVDSSPERKEQAEKAGFPCCTDLETALEKKPDLAFVCTSPGQHADIILRLVHAGVDVFTELNLTDKGYEEIIKRADDKDVKVFMSSTMLYNKQIESIRDCVKKTDKPLTYIYHVGQYLPDWHPWENYRDFFVGKKETNGVREILAVQLPWMIEVFGGVDTFYVLSNKCTDLDIEFQDSVAVSFRHKSGNIGVFVADVVSRRAVVCLEIIGEDLHIFWNGHNDDLFVYDLEESGLKQVKEYQTTEHINGYADNIIEEPYKDEIRDFLKTVYADRTPRYSLQKDQYILSLIDEILREGG